MSPKENILEVTPITQFTILHVMFKITFRDYIYIYMYVCVCACVCVCVRVCACSDKFASIDVVFKSC